MTGEELKRPGLSFVLILCCLLASGCFGTKSYRYQSIMAEHGVPSAVQSAEEHPKFEADLTALERPISVIDAIALALRNNPDMDIAMARILESEAMIDEAWAAFWPALSAYVEYTRADAPSAYLFKKIDQRRFVSGTNFNDPGEFQNFESGLSARYGLYRGGRDWLRKRMAETGLKIEAFNRSAVENGLTASVIHAYYNVLAAQDYIRIAQESVETVEAQLRIMNVQFEGGSVLKSDILSLKVRVAEARENLIRAENNEKLSLSALANLLGADADRRLELTPESSPESSNGQWAAAALPPDYVAGLAEALKNRPELLKAREQVVHAAMAFDMKKGEYLPTLDIEGKYYGDDANLKYDQDRANWVAGAVVNWDIFTGLSTKAGEEKARSVLKQMIAADRKASLSVQLDVKTAYLRLSEAEARLAVARAGTAQAQESLRLVKRQYEGGAATVTRYLDAELALNTSRVRETAAFYDIKKAQADIGRAVGYCARRDANGP